jgi:D-serine deaminase-like pyridoxal phosphate-dependent protein
MSIAMKELNPKGFVLSAVQSSNLVDLHRRINVVRSAYGKPMTVTSGVRSLEDHKRIYAEIARKKGLKAFRVPMGSKHLSAQAVDIADGSGALYRWCKENDDILETAGLYCEEGTKGWVHFQTVPPKSGRRWFLP